MRRAQVLLLAIVLAACGTSTGLETVYRSPEKARTTLTAMQTLRYHSAGAVAEAYVRGYIPKERADQFEKLDNQFRSAWGIASELVAQWLVSNAKPAALDAKMDEVALLAAQVEEEGRKVQ